MGREFDRDRVAALGWGQGAILDRRVAEFAWEHAPERVKQGDRDRLLVTSHDCDVLNASIVKEPLVEVLRARALDDSAGQRGPLSSGRNPRALRLSEVSVQGDDVALDLAVHDRWGIPRELHTLRELPADTSYTCHLLLGVPSRLSRLADWPKTREAIERAFTESWGRLSPAIECELVEVVTTDLITVDDISRYQRFDADWVSFDDDTAVTSIAADFRA